MNYFKILMIFALAGLSSCYYRSKHEPLDLTDPPGAKYEISNILKESYTTPPPPISDYFPCSQCHDELPINNNRRELVEMHDDIVFDHDSENRWCLACHDAEDRDSLRLASGVNISFEESYRLCGQCHGPKLRDWKLGIHGKRTGNWNGQKEYLLCVHCHDPHDPKFKSLKPMPRPQRPEELILDSLITISHEEK